MAEFRIACIDAMNSVVASPDEFATVVEPELSLLRTSYSYCRTGIQPWNMPGLHIIRASDNPDPDSVDRWDRLHDTQQFENCAEYLWYRNSFHIVEGDKSEDLKCSCPSYVRSHVCKHILLIRHQKYNFEFPTNAINVELSNVSKRKAHRPGEVLIQQHNRKRKR